MLTENETMWNITNIKSLILGGIELLKTLHRSITGK